MAANSGITSVLRGPNAPPPSSFAADVNQASFIDDALGGLIGGATGGIGSAIGGAIGGIFGGSDDSMSGADMGAEQRAFMEAAFPELNPWEMAGATSSAGEAAGGQDSAAKLQEEQLKSNERIAGMNAATSRYTADKQQETALEVAGVQSVTSMRNVDEQLIHQRDVAKSSIDNLAAQTNQLTQAKSPVGKVADDVVAIGKNLEKEFGRSVMRGLDFTSGDQSELNKNIGRLINRAKMLFDKAKRGIKDHFDSRGASGFDSRDIDMTQTDVTDLDKLNKFMSD